MAIKIGTTEVTGVDVGLTRVHSVYVGIEKIWEAVIIPTEVKYTSESGLPDWTGNVEGALIGSTTAPNTKIPNVASSEEITLGNGIITIGNRAFLSCTTLKSISIPDNVLVMGINCFESCSQLSGIVIPKDIKTIPNWAFYRCSSLQSVGLPDGLSSIGAGSFHTCTSLANITMPSGVVDIGNNAFNGCSALSVIDMSNATQVPTIGQYTFYNTNNSFQVIVPLSLYEQWKQAKYWSSITGTIVPATSWLHFTAQEANSTIRLDKVGSPNAISLETSPDGTTWTDYGWTDLSGDTLTMTNIGDRVYIRAKTENSTIGSGWADYYKFVGTGSFAASGNIQSLLKKDCSRTDAPEYCYTSMFQGCNSLTTPPELPATTLGNRCYGNMFRDCNYLTQAPALPATTLAPNCYNIMFQGCTSLATPPELPATTLATNCYMSMFQGCTSLTTAPSLPATTLTTQCYSNMFKGCSSLTTAPELPATTLAQSCYNAMFWNCTSLTQAPELPATTLADHCYSSMFYGCSSLSSITVGFSDWQAASSPTANWVNGVAATGTFTCPSGLSDLRGENNIPTGWTKTDA